MRKARKKPVEINFMTFDEIWKIKQTHDNINDIDERMDIPYVDIEIYHEPYMYLIIPTLEGKMKMTNNDVLIVGVQNEIYPCKIDIFKQTYDFDGEL